MKIYTDGGARGNPGPAACAFVVYQEGRVVFELGRYLGVKTNNEAEYQGVIESLLYLQNQANLPPRIDWYLDSKLVVEQISGRWKVKNERLFNLRRECLELLAVLFPDKNYAFHHVPRAQNAAADQVLNRTLDQHQT